MGEEHMEEEHTHQLHLADRRSGQITGVVDVQAFDENEIRLETQQGMLQIQGKDLHVGRLQLDRGEIDIQGEVTSLIYRDGRGQKRKKEQSLLGRLFQ